MPDPARDAERLAAHLSATAPGFGQAGGPRRGRVLRLHRADTARDDRARMELASFQFDMMRGRQVAYIEPHPGESDADFAQRPHLRTLNLTHLVVDVLSGLYRSPVERTLLHTRGAPTRAGVDPAWAGALRLFTDGHATDTVYASADRLTRLHGVAALQPYWREGRLGLRVIPAHRMALVRDPGDGSRAVAVVVVGRAMRPGESAGPAAVAGYADVWTARSFARMQGTRVIERRRNPYGVLPFVLVRDDPAADDVYGEGRGRSLCFDNASLNARLSDLAHVIALQGFGVMEVVNPDPTQSLRLGPGRAVAFRIGPDMPYGISFKNPGAPIAELCADIEQSVRHILLSQRIPESAVSVSMGSNASGVAIHAAGTPVTEDRVERVKLFHDVERRVFEVATRIAAHHAGLDAAGAPALRVDFPEPDLARDLADRRAHDEWLLSRGMATPWGIMRRDNPDAYPDDEAARAAWLANVRGMAAEAAAGADGARGG